MAELIKTDRFARGKMRRQLRGMLLFLPNLVKLMYRLLRDPRVARADKAILAGTILYVITPLDFLPDLIPFIGQIDDIYLVAIAILRLLNRTPEEVFAQHWDTNLNLKGLVASISNIAGFFLPKRLRNALTGRLEPQKAEIIDFESYA